LGVATRESEWRDEQQRFVEEVGVLLEESGLSRMAGRVVGRLLICDEPYQSASELAQALQASAGSISAATRALIQMHVIERVGLPGERRDYFRIRPRAWVELLRVRLQVAHRFVSLAERGLALAGEGAPQTERLAVARDVYAIAAEIAEELIDQWERSRGGVPK
jgi:DNA-binding transcriptional regulator GbsR (MarR family)